MHPEKEKSIRIEKAIEEINSNFRITDEIVISVCNKYKVKRSVIVEIAGFTNDWKYPEFKGKDYVNK